MIFFYRYFSGCLKVIFKGEFTERVLNLCAENGIKLWSAKSENGRLTAFITLKDFYLLPDVISGSKIRVHIEERYGFPFVLSRYRKRPGILIGVLIFITFLEFMSGFIWVIDIKGNEKIESEKIMTALEKIGIYEGIFSDKISPKSDSQRLLLQLDGLAWASLNIEGSRLTVNVTEAEEKDNSDNRPCNLKAEFDGVITKIDLTSGDSVVKVGDTVKKGDVLVSGIIENAGGTRFVRSQGNVIATVRREFEISQNFTEELTVETGKVKEKSVLELFTLKIPLYLGTEKSEYVTEDSKQQLKLFGVRLPMRIYTREFKYTEIASITRTEERIIEELENELQKILEEEEITDYTVEDKTFDKNDEGITLKITLLSQQNIAYEDFLLISTGN